MLRIADEIILTFDSEGCIDPSAFDRHQRARAELALAPLIAASESTATVVDAAQPLRRPRSPLGAIENSGAPYRRDCPGATEMSATLGPSLQKPRARQAATRPCFQ